MTAWLLSWFFLSILNDAIWCFVQKVNWQHCRRTSCSGRRWACAFSVLLCHFRKWRKVATIRRRRRTLWRPSRRSASMTSIRTRWPTTRPSMARTKDSTTEHGRTSRTLPPPSPIYTEVLIIHRIYSFIFHFIQFIILIFYYIVILLLYLQRYLARMNLKNTASPVSNLYSGL